jgi:hypothetical protein
MYLRVPGVPDFLLMVQEITGASRPHELHPIHISDADEQDAHSVAPSFIYKSLYLYPNTELSIKSYYLAKFLNGEKDMKRPAVGAPGDILDRNHAKS